ncbi:MAG: hypothetical protein A4E32_01205 [Methanomassiliicoccales archaeon PtaU1.Bin124]|nr:MAG: hypothetical protein A4E32_01205 [Methanomassiliicoccales archaeon PtaU1.Bin124]
MDDMELFISDFTDFLNKFQIEKGVLFGPFLPEGDGQRRDVMVVLVCKRWEGFRMQERRVPSCLEVRKLLGLSAVIDLYLYTPREFEHNLKYNGLLQIAVRDGIVIRPTTF